MGLLDQLTHSVLGKSDDAAPDAQTGTLSAIMNFINQQEGGLSGLVGKFQNGGLGEIVNSWVSTGANLPVSAEQIQTGLGSEQINDLASKLGLDPAETASALAQNLPKVIDTLTPNGSLEGSDSLATSAFETIKNKLFG